MAEFAPFHAPTLDWLDVTYSPDDNPAELLMAFLDSQPVVSDDGMPPSHSRYRFVVFDGGLPDVEYGSLDISTKYKAYRVSASGAFLAGLRSRGLFDEYLTILASSPYRVTRLDAAIDRQVDASVVLANLDTRYPREVSLSRQRPLRTTMITSRRDDGLRTGTWYAGHRSRARVTARVYDKTAEILERSGVDIGHKFTRYELTFREGTANLNDAYAPSGIFWAHVGALLDVPADAPAWSVSDVPAWVSERSEVLPYDALLRRVSSSSELDGLLRLADRLGPEGRNTLLHMLAKKFGLDFKGQYFARSAA
jgi:hypothetical protein